MATETDDNSKSLLLVGLGRQVHVFLDDFEIYKLPNFGRRHEKKINPRLQCENCQLCLDSFVKTWL
jgi:hypothetical protein